MTCSRRRRAPGDRQPRSRTRCGWKTQNSRAERDNFRARCEDLGAGQVQAVSGALADVERLTQVNAELAKARRDA
jgi:hypothetical protein